MSQLPEGWEEVNLIELLLSLESGSRPKGGVRGISNGVPSIGGEHITYSGAFDFSSIKYVPKDFAMRMVRGHIRINDILVVKDGATTGKAALVTEDFPYDRAVVNEHVFICRLADVLNTTYIFRYLISKDGQERVLENFKGSAQGGINLSFASNTLIPLAPIDEQDRIVRKMEALLGKVESCQQRLAKIPMILKRFRQSVLSAACEGELTVDWREIHEHSEWETKTLGELITPPKNGYSVKPVYYQTDYRVLTLTATTSGKFSSDYFKYFDEYIPADSPLWLKPDDILVQRGNTIEYVGVSAIYNGKPNQFVYPDLMIKFRANDLVSTKFLHLMLSWERTRNYFRENATGTAGNMPKINQKVLVSAPINVPSKSEQQEIVCRVESLFQLADHLETRYRRAKAQVDKLQQSILAKAFRAELVPTEAELAKQEGREYESAAMLLERVRAQRISEEVKSKRNLKIRMPAMTKVTKEIVIDVINQFSQDQFSFDDLRQKVPTDYESLKEIVFALLSEPEPQLMQVFDQELKAMRFARSHK